MELSARRLALDALERVAKGAYADVALHQVLQQYSHQGGDRALITELVYGTIRQQRTLDTLVQGFCQQLPPLKVQLVLRLGLYQLRYLDRVPPHAAVDTSVELVKEMGLGGFAKLVNGVLRRYTRSTCDPLEAFIAPLPLVSQLGCRYSFPDELIASWLERLGQQECIALCQWFNHPPRLDLRLNPLRTTANQLMADFAAAGCGVKPIPDLPQGLVLPHCSQPMQSLPGYREGHWSVQDRAAQWVSHLLDPQAGEVVIDACAAPGGKTTHIAELMADQGRVIACDRTPSRLRKLQQNRDRLGLKSIEIHTLDSSTAGDFAAMGDRVLLDVPCSGTGTLHRHADSRWQPLRTRLAELLPLQAQLLANVCQWVKPQGLLVYATCSLEPAENEAQIQHFLAHHPQWHIERPPPTFPLKATPEGWITVWPQRHDMDGFFMVRLRRGS
ncbi:16S rRNA (cytosine(967)-C(5))-methyltransferase [Thermosynechococcus sp. JY1334]|uniref:16S rRNA (cytosine(967)-C(5))-methyltransferase n=1 Tax=unclassified Thermosynechococcus TaxID=2622553 RepID=UPI002673C9CF|nr:MULTISPECIES: 16S rRNA (cytosine(967)-C(5))-methyltransferase [unclassified Thermosynechococcus]MDR7898975.1 16S rRNA (cytosine(967)-C(5))-methyltransferase [Thermosynechococcus sp. JY1332]MDR7906380.1 16S rRNA (cytosine(967)-C(5))-methyltransferase [Thermosynechococcus sp. JY1334]WKT86099.1 16S rRNA (cytosine(967)-C(5))-methyltransferase [Thermosynechococcus sp. JY1339]WNC55044.1 16S rRNA (cytosine(967)-C(5))-methyltransferase [Thermosynechococcus sp. JY1331]